MPPSTAGTPLCNQVSAPLDRMRTEEPEMRRRLRPLENDDLLSEFLLRLPPQPSSLTRASLVCKGWRSLVSDPGFSRRFRIHHCRNPPLLGYFDRCTGVSFVPTLDAPNRVPPGRFSLRSDYVPVRLDPYGCRHGLALFYNWAERRFFVWDPLTDHQHWLSAVPQGLDATRTIISGTVLRAAGAVNHFRVVVVSTKSDSTASVQHTRAVACVYSSETGAWGDLISTPLPHVVSEYNHTHVAHQPAVMVAGSLHWLLEGNFEGILEFDVERWSLGVIRAPADIVVDDNEENATFTVIRAENGGLGFLFVSETNFRAQLWKREADRGGVVSWVLERTVELDKLLPSLDLKKSDLICIVGYAEENNLVFLHLKRGLFVVQFQSLEFKKVSELHDFDNYLPFESVYAAGI